MEEKMNLSDFTKDGSPVVEQKQEEDAVQEQSTDEVPLRDESKTSKEVLEQNVEATDENLPEKATPFKMKPHPLSRK